MFSVSYGAAAGGFRFYNADQYYAYLFISYGECKIAMHSPGG